MKCGNCGFENSKDKKFCTECGARLETEGLTLRQKIVMSVSLAVALMLVLGLIFTVVFVSKNGRSKGEDFAVLESVSEPSSEVSSSSQDISSAEDVTSSEDIQSQVLSSDTAPEPQKFSLTDGYFYEYSLQDTFADEWRFYSDGTCTAEMRSENGVGTHTSAEYTYSVNGNIVSINKEGQTVDWGFSPLEQCCYYYFYGSDGSSLDDASVKYRVTIFHSDNKLTQAEIDNGIDDYSREHKHIITL